MKPIEAIPSDFLKIKFYFIFPYTLRSARSPFLQVSPSKSCMNFSSPHKSNWPAHFILLDLIVRIIFDVVCESKEYLINSFCMLGKNTT
jgi:hypothetical protein